MKKDQLIITAGSEAFGPSLLALLGSLNLNWPNHPPVHVYDIGLDDDTLRILYENNIEVVKVPQFCPHWRKHFSWKIWCWNDAPAQNIVWMDAGLVVLKPLDEIFHSLSHLGYFAVPNYHLLDWEASDAACIGCGVETNFKNGKLTMAGGLIGFCKQGKILEILKEALYVALTEKYIAASKPSHRHDQAIISLLLYKHLGNVIMSDGTIYLGWTSPQQTYVQKVWVHRRHLSKEDIEIFSSHIVTPGEAYIPKDPNYFVYSGSFLHKAYKLIRYKLIRKVWLYVRHPKKLLLKDNVAKNIYNGIKD